MTDIMSNIGISKISRKCFKEDHSMRIEHIAILTTQLEKLKDFYVAYFNAKANKKYINSTKGNFTK